MAGGHSLVYTNSGDPLEVVTATDPRTEAVPTRTRPIGGLAVLLMVFVLVLAAPVLTRADVTGRAEGVPLPVVPAPGTCLASDGPQVRRVASCQEPHDAEVIRSWERGPVSLPMPSFADVAAAGTGIDAPPVCLEARNGYVRAGLTEHWGIWLPTEPAVTSRLIAAPPGERVGDEGWLACVVRTLDGERFTGSVRNGLAHDRTDARLTSCLPSRSAPDRSRWVTCDQPHHIEVLGAFDLSSVFDAQGQWVGVPSADLLRLSCLGLARAMTWADDATYQGALEVHAEPLQPDLVGVHRPGDTSNSDAGYVTLPRPLCFVETTGAAPLTVSVIALGNQPLPVG